MKRIIKKVLIGYVIFLVIVVTAVGYHHSYREHEDFTIALLFPPWATYRGVESFTHNYDQPFVTPSRSY